LTSGTRLDHGGFADYRPDESRTTRAPDHDPGALAGDLAACAQLIVTRTAAARQTQSAVAAGSRRPDGTSRRVRGDEVDRYAGVDPAPALPRDARDTAPSGYYLSA